MPTTRLAPSPTGALHLGNARTFLINWAIARRHGWQVVMRIEDLDGPRVKKGADRELLDTLAWLGIDWDGEPSWQSADLEPYRVALRDLAERGEIYPCRCTRSEILAASLTAPHAGEHETRYPGTCRPPDGTMFDFDSPEYEGAAWRLRTPDEAFDFTDEFAGPQSYNTHRMVGDFLVATKAGMPSYQIAVAIDDARQQVDRIVRGDDLLTSTPRQLLLYNRLGLSPQPQYWHVPLVLGPDGRRLAKRHGDTRVEHYRNAGVKPERLIGLLAQWCGLGPRRKMSAAEFAAAFEIDRVSLEPMTFWEPDDDWLLGDS